MVQLPSHYNLYIDDCVSKLTYLVSYKCYLNRFDVWKNLYGRGAGMHRVMPWKHPCASRSALQQQLTIATDRCIIDEKLKAEATVTTKPSKCGGMEKRDTVRQCEANLSGPCRQSKYGFGQIPTGPEFLPYCTRSLLKASQSWVNAKLRGLALVQNREPCKVFFCLQRYACKSCNSSNTFAAVTPLVEASIHRSLLHGDETMSSRGTTT